MRKVKTKKNFYQKPSVKVKAVDCDEMLVTISKNRSDNDEATPLSKQFPFDDPDDTESDYKSIWDK